MFSDPHVATLARIPAIWAHKHYRGAESEDFDATMVEVCETCADILDERIAAGEWCPIHGSPYMLSGVCLECAKSEEVAHEVNT
jgi:hypothetical protein